MLETIDAEKFYSGHFEVTDREGIRNHIADVKKTQEKVRALILEGINLEEIQKKFNINEARLTEAIYYEIKGTLE